MYAKIMSAAAIGLLVAACGTDPQERVQGGAAAGAATGAGIGALGGPVGALAGAAIGGGAGAITGATTESRDVNLGRPIWERPETRVPGVTDNSRRGSAGSASTRQAQQALASRGFNPGPADGIWGDRSRQATMDFQRANNLPTTGQLDSQTMSALNVSATTSMNGRTDRNRAYQGGGMLSQGNTDRSGMATDADPGTGGTGGSGGSTQTRPPGSPSAQPSLGNANPSMRGPSGGPMERSGMATGADPGTGGTGGSGGGATAAPGRAPTPGVTSGNRAGGPAERSGSATDADPGTGGTGGSGGGATGTTIR